MYAEKIDDDALLNCCNALHELLFAVLREIVELLPPSWNPRDPDTDSDAPTARVEVPVVFSVPLLPAV